MKQKYSLLIVICTAVLTFTGYSVHPFFKNSFFSELFSSKTVTASENKISKKVAPLKHFETIMDRYFRRDLVAELESSINRQVDDYNQWVMSNQKKFKIKDAELEVQRNAIRDMETSVNRTLDKLKQMKGHLDSKEKIAKYNRMVETNNALVEKRNALIMEYKKEEASYNQALSKYNSNAKHSMALIEQTKNDAKKKINEYNAWQDSDNDVEFFNELNAYFAQLLKVQQRNPETFTRSSEIRTIQKIRKELAEFTRKKYESDKNGLIIVEALLCGKVKGFFMVDTGATDTTIHPAMIEALGISVNTGKEAEYTIADGTKKKARQVRIPQMSVSGKSAINVEAAMLPPADVGIDGLLGHSFLNHFDYRIVKKSKSELFLKEK